MSDELPPEDHPSRTAPDRSRARSDGGSSGEKRPRILDAAIEVFAERGFYRARIADIAERAKVAEGTIYNYFHNKDEVLITIFEEKMMELISGLRAELVGVDDPLQQVRVFSRYHFRQVEDHRALAEVLQVELRLSHKFLKEYRPRRLWEYLNIFADIVRRGQERGVVVAEADPQLLSWAFFGAMDELAIQWVLSKKPRFSLDAAASAVAEVFVHGIASGPSSTFPGHEPDNKLSQEES